MGNQLSARTGVGTSTVPLESLVNDLENVEYDRTIGSARLLKSARVSHRNGLLVVKVFPKPRQTVSLRATYTRLRDERDALQTCSNVLAYQELIETENVGYMIRPWLMHNLYDRISTKPFLLESEKLWIAFQLLVAVRDSHAAQVPHGDIKTENVLLTSTNWVFLADFASYKPTYLPLDDPSAYGVFFDTANRRSCYIAPERFYDEASRQGATLEQELQTLLNDPDADLGAKPAFTDWGRENGTVNEKMDIFSVGCVITELWQDGRSAFSLSDLFKYRGGGSFSPDVENDSVKQMILRLTHHDPNSRPTAQECLESFKGSVFPHEFYDLLHPILATLHRPVPVGLLPSSARGQVSVEPSNATPSVSAAAAIVAATSANPDRPAPSSAGASHVGNPIVEMYSDADSRVQALWNAFPHIVATICSKRGEDVSAFYAPSKRHEPNTPMQTSSNASRAPLPDTFNPDNSAFPIVLGVPGVQGRFVRAIAAERDEPLAVILLSVLSSSLRNVIYPGHIIQALDLLLAFSPFLTAATLIERTIPYLVSLFNYSVPTVTASSVVYIAQLISLLGPSVHPSLLNEYILPKMRTLSVDVEVSVRCAFAEALVILLLAVEGSHSEAAKAPRSAQSLAPHDSDALTHTTSNLSKEVPPELQLQLQEHLQTLLTDPSAAVRRSLLMHVRDLRTALGSLRVAEDILAYLNTYLNDSDWQLRATFYEQVPYIVSLANEQILDEFVLPLMIHGISDEEEFVTARVLATFTVVARQYKVTMYKLWSVVNAASGFLCHPNGWIRQCAATFLVTCAAHTSPTDRWCLLYPTIKRMLRSDVAEITTTSLLSNARDPLTRPVLDAALAWAARSVKAAHKAASDKKRSSKGKSAQPESSHFSGLQGFWKQRAPSSEPLSDKEHAERQRLLTLGMRPDDEFKLLALRDYILRLVTAKIRRGTALRSLYGDTDSEAAAFTAGGSAFVPNTVFITSDEQYDNTAQESSLPLTGDPSSNRLDYLKRHLADTAGISYNARPPSQHMSPSEKSAALPVPKQTQTSGFSSPKAPSFSLPRGNAISIEKTQPSMQPDETHAQALLSHEDQDHPAPGASKSAQFRSSYDGNDHRVLRLLANAYSDAQRVWPLDLGPRIPANAILNTTEPASLPLALRSCVRGRRAPNHTKRNPSNLLKSSHSLIAHYMEHTDAVTHLVMGPCDLFFCSASLDHSVRLWDTTRLEKNVNSLSRHHWLHKGPVLAMCFVDSSFCIASADETEIWIHSIRLDLSSVAVKYPKPRLVRSLPVKSITPGIVSCLASYSTPTHTYVLCGTSQGTVNALDIADMSCAFVLDTPDSESLGAVTSIVVDPEHASWLLAGTSFGKLVLYDLRFRILVRQWYADSKGPQAAVTQIQIHPSLGFGRFVIVAVDSAQSSPILSQVWDIETQQLVQVFARYGPSTSLSIDSLLAKSPPPAKTAAEAIEQLLSKNAGASDPFGSNNLVSSATHTLALAISRPKWHQSSLVAVSGPALEMTSSLTLPPSDPFLYTAGSDRTLRAWALDGVDKSFTVSGGIESQHASLRYSQGQWLTLSNPGVKSDHALLTHVEFSPSDPPPPLAQNQQGRKPAKPSRSAAIDSREQQLLRGHRNTITAIIVTEWPFRCVISADRSGIINVYE